MSGLHDENSPSVLHRRLLCAGSANAERGLPDTPSEAGARGTLGHAWSAHRLKPDDFGAPLEALTDAESEAVGYYVGVVRAMSPAAHAVLLVEHRVRLEEIGIIEGGSIDAAWIDTAERCGVLLDFKSGHVPVKGPRYNPQAIAYSLGLLAAFGLEYVDAVIVQPAMDEANRVRVHRFTRADLWAHGVAIEEGIAATKDPAAPRVPGPEQCEHCRARFTCVERTAAIESTQRYTSLTNAEAVRAMSPAARGYWWPRILEARKRLEEIEALFGSTVLEHRLDVEGFAIVPGKRGHRRWVDADAALVTGRGIALARGLDPDALIETKVKSPAEFDAILGKSQPVREKLEPLVTQFAGAPRLVQKGA